MAIYLSRINCGMKQSKYSQLNDPDWLIQQYSIDGLSSEKIKQIVGCPSCASVTQALRRHSIPIRTKSEGHRVNRKDDGFVLHKDVVEGCLLGDGFMRSDNPMSNDSFPFFAKRNIHYDHVQYVGKILFGDEVDNRITLRHGKDSHASGIFELKSLSHPSLIELYRTWYPPSNDYKKIVPESIEVTPSLLLHWFLDDGYSYYYTRLQRYRYTRLEFACMSFTVQELDMLCAKIKDVFGLTMFIREHRRNGKLAGTGCEVHVKQSDIPLFFEIIGPPPVPSLAYKWK